jgi:hypothetical protein
MYVIDSLTKHLLSASFHPNEARFDSFPRVDDRPGAP